MLRYCLLLGACLTGAFGIYQENVIVCLLSGALLCLLTAISLRGRFQQAIVILASILFSWTAIEAALGFMEPRADIDVVFLDPANDTPVSYWQTNDAYGVLPLPGTHRAKKLAKDGGVIYDVVYTMDSNGFRDMAHTRGATGGEVVFLGGSTTFGEGLNDDQTLPYHFSQRRPNLIVRNLAVSGWGLHQAFSLWKDTIKEAGTTVIVQTAPWHADRMACIPKYSSLSPRYEYVDGDFVQNGRCRTWFKNTILARLMIQFGVMQRLYDVANLERYSQKMDHYIAMLMEMKALAEEREQCLVVSFLKAEDDYLSGTDYTNESIKKALMDDGLNVVDTTLADSMQAISSRYVIEGDGHPTNEANERRAEILSNVVEQCHQQRLAKHSGIMPALNFKGDSYE